MRGSLQLLKVSKDSGLIRAARREDETHRGVQEGLEERRMGRRGTGGVEEDGGGGAEDDTGR